MRLFPILAVAGVWSLGCASCRQDCDYRPGLVDTPVALVVVKLRQSRECAAILSWQVVSEGGVTTVSTRTKGKLDAVLVDLLDLRDPDPTCDPLGPQVCGGWSELIYLDELDDDVWGYELDVITDPEALRDGETTLFDTPEELAALTVRVDGRPPGAFICAVGGEGARDQVAEDPDCKRIPRE